MRPSKRPAEIIVISDSDDESAPTPDDRRNKTPRLKRTTSTNNPLVNVDSEDDGADILPFNMHRRKAPDALKKEGSELGGLHVEDQWAVPDAFNNGQPVGDQFGGGQYDGYNFDFQQYDEQLGNDDFDFDQFENGHFGGVELGNGSAGNGIDFLDDNDEIEIMKNNGTFEFLRLQPPNRRSETPQPQVSLEDKCLHRVLEMFPDIAHDHVMKLFGETEGHIHDILERIIETANYPKQRDRKEKEAAPRASTAEVEEKRFTAQDRETARGRKRQAILRILKDEFPKIPVTFIEATQLEKTHLYASYMALDEAENTQPQPYKNAGWRPIRNIDFVTIAALYGPATLVLEEELGAARKARSARNAERRKKAARERDELTNVELAKATGATTECATCFDDCPLNRAIHCNDAIPHFTCFDCMLTYIQSEIGQSRCTISCPDSSGCKGSFTEVQLQLIPEKELVAKLLRLQQEKYVRDAGVDDVVECPFCDFKAVCPPVEVDFEFRCGNHDCSVVSCRKCQLATHTPLTCEEFARTKSKDAALEQRHKIEEAMTKALVRNCNNCKKPFIKDYGCNKMSCPSCGNMQCYACSKNVVNYNHFGRTACPLNDNVEERHEKDVKAAEEAARAQVQAENPDVATEHLDFKVSERVKQDERAAEERRRRHLHGGVAYPHWAGNRIPGAVPDLREEFAAMHDAVRGLNGALFGANPHPLPGALPARRGQGENEQQPLVGLHMLPRGLREQIAMHLVPGQQFDEAVLGRLNEVNLGPHMAARRRHLELLRRAEPGAMNMDPHGPRNQDPLQAQLGAPPLNQDWGAMFEQHERNRRAQLVARQDAMLAFERHRDRRGGGAGRRNAHMNVRAQQQDAAAPDPPNWRMNGAPPPVLENPLRYRQPVLPLPPRVHPNVAPLMYGGMPGLGRYVPATNEPGHAVRGARALERDP